jgi:hypothetical protein
MERNGTTSLFTFTIGIASGDVFRSEYVKEVQHHVPILNYAILKHHGDWFNHGTSTNNSHFVLLGRGTGYLKVVKGI